ncbi:MAG: glycosyl transferase [bacterium]|nr:glycosyl transferase [bacterium]
MMSRIRETARKLGMGRALRRYYHTPVGTIRNSIAEGGPWEQRRTEAGRREMVAAAECLTPISPPASAPLASVAFLSGERFWYQTVFCFVSLQRHVERRIDLVVYDDGTLSALLRAKIARVVPWVQFVDAADVEVVLDRLLPRATFPALRARRDVYPHLRKLTDLHVGAEGWSLVMDSDMLFFRRPDAVIDFLVRPEVPIHLAERQSAYGYSSELIEELAQGDVPERVNVGLYGVRSADIDWHHMEHCCRIQIEREGPLYLQEQALTAILLAGTGARALPIEDYVVLPSIAEGRNPSGVMHHYVAHSKRAYFQYGWRHVLADITGEPVTGAAQP